MKQESNASRPTHHSGQAAGQKRQEEDIEHSRKTLINSLHKGQEG